jgi:4-hydroxy-2-oxoglutarate aldolase
MEPPTGGAGRAPAVGGDRTSKGGRGEAPSTEGVSTAPPPVTELVIPMVTPYDARGEVDLGAIARNLRRLQGTPLTGVLALGTNGEHPLLGFEEKVRILEATAAHRGRLDFYAHVWHQDERRTLELATIARELGAKANLALTPTYYTPSYRLDVLRRYYATLCRVGTTYLYYIPQNAGLTLSADDILALAEEGVAGMKDSSGQLAQLGEVLARRPAGFRVLVGSGQGFLGALAQGADGGILAAAHAGPWLAEDVAQHLEAGDLGAAQAAQARLTRLSVLVGRRYGIAGLKALVEHLGLEAGPPRPPLPALSPEAEEAIRTEAAELGLRRLDG